MKKTPWLPRDRSKFEQELSNQETQTYTYDALRRLRGEKQFIVVPQLDDNIPAKMEGYFALAPEIVPDLSYLAHTDSLLFTFRSVADALEIGGVCMLSSGKVLRFSLVEDDRGQRITFASHISGQPKYVFLHNKIFNVVEDQHQETNDVALCYSPADTSGDYIETASMPPVAVDLVELLQDKTVTMPAAYYSFAIEKTITCSYKEVHAILGKITNGVASENAELILAACAQLQALCELNASFGYSL